MAIGARALRAGKAIIELSLLKGPIEKELSALEKRMRSFGNTMTNVGKHAAIMGGAMLTPFIAGIKAASDAQSSMRRFQAVFGEQAAAAEEFATRTAKALGRSRFQIMDALSTYQALFQGLGFGGEQARKFSEQVQAMAVDLGALRGISDEEMAQRMIAALSGSAEVLDQFGVNIRQAEIEQELFRMGINKTAQEASEMEKTVARVNLIFASMQRSNTIGFAAENTDLFSEQMKRLKAQLQEAAIALGNAVLPLVTRYLQAVIPLVTRIMEWIQANDALALGLFQIATIITAGGGLLVALGQLTNAWVSVAAAIRSAAAAGTLFRNVMAGIATAGIGTMLLMLLEEPEKAGGGRNARARQRELEARMKALSSATAGSGLMRGSASSRPGTWLRDFHEARREWLDATSRRLHPSRTGDAIRARQEEEARQHRARLRQLFGANAYIDRKAGTPGRATEALFDTRLARQIFGGGDVQQQQLKELKGIRRAVEHRDTVGIAVI